MKRHLALIVAAGALALPASALAGPGGTHGYGSQPGFDQSNGNTQCAGHGAFGAFGEKGDVTHDFRGGANGQQTGINNATLCGNRQGNL